MTLWICYWRGILDLTTKLLSYLDDRRWNFCVHELLYTNSGLFKFWVCVALQIKKGPQKGQIVEVVKRKIQLSQITKISLRWRFHYFTLCLCFYDYKGIAIQHKWSGRKLILWVGFWFQFISWWRYRIHEISLVMSGSLGCLNLIQFVFVLCSTRQDDVFVVHVEHEYGSVLESMFKTEFLSIISKRYKEMIKRDLHIEFADQWVSFLFFLAISLMQQSCVLFGC